MLVIISYVSLGLEELMENKGSLMLPQPVFFFFLQKVLFIYVYLFIGCTRFSLLHGLFPSRGKQGRLLVVVLGLSLLFFLT